MRTRILMVVAVVTALLGVSTAAVGLALSGGRGEGMGQGMAMSSMPWHGSESARGPAGGMHAMMVATEFEYLAEMVAHHEEAVTSAAELQRSGRAEMRDFGAAIVETQSAQIRQMKSWLAQWYPGRSTDVDYEPMMRDLSGLSGDDLDRAFLEDMTHHHMMAVMMSQQALASDVLDHSGVRDLAVSIRDEQRAEIVQMRRWMADWFGTGAGHMGDMGHMNYGMGW